MIRLEHANLIVRDMKSMTRYLQTAFPAFRIRREGVSASGKNWVHIGDDVTYIAMTEAYDLKDRRWVPYSGRPGLNHLGFEIADAAALRERMLAAGYNESTYPNAHPHRTRVYFHDPEGNDWEFVEYHSEKVEERNDYELDG